MGDVVQGAFRRQASWGAFVEICPSPGPGGAEAKLTGFWGSDGLEVAERRRTYASALSRLSDELLRTADEIDPEPFP